MKSSQKQPRSVLHFGHGSNFVPSLSVKAVRSGIYRTLCLRHIMVLSVARITMMCYLLVK